MGQIQDAKFELLARRNYSGVHVRAVDTRYRAGYTAKIQIRVGWHNISRA